MSAVWYWTLRSLRARARAYAGVAVLLALLGGLTLASFAGARRTASAYPRFREAGGALDLQVNSGDFEVEHPDVAGQMPGVTATATYMAFLAGVLTPDGRPDLSVTAEVAGSLDGLYFTHDRFAVTQGRLPDASRPDEVAVNEHLARAQGMRVGQRLEIGVVDPADEEALYGETTPPLADRLDVTVVAIGVFPDEVVQDDTDRFPRMLLTPAFTQRERAHATYAWTGVAVEGGEAGVDRFKREYVAALPEDAPASFRQTSMVTARTQQAVRPLAVALAVFGALAAVATLLLVGQALVRLLRTDRDESRRGPWRLPGPDLRRRAAMSLSLGSHHEPNPPAHGPVSFATVMGPPRCHDLGTTSGPLSRSREMILRWRWPVKNPRWHCR